MPARARQLLTRHGWLIAIALAYLYVFPYFPRIHNANEVPRVYLVQAMVDEGTFAIDAGVVRWGKTSDLAKWNGHYYSNKAPGSSMLAVPGYLVLKGVAAIRGTPPTLGEMTWVARFTTGVLPQLAFLWLLTEKLANELGWPVLRTRRPDNPSDEFLLRVSQAEALRDSSGDICGLGQSLLEFRTFSGTGWRPQFVLSGGVFVRF